jgi:ubiquinone/menaquinone biosynthesis C-methylase UbiE
LESKWRNILKKIEPEGIPWPMSLVYNRLSASSIFIRHYELLARDILDLCPAGKILDIGTGPGRLLLALNRLDPGLELCGADISEAMIARAKQNCIEAGVINIDLCIAGALSLPYPDNYFDAVISTGSLHHWKDPVAGLNEVYRVLKPGGFALIYDLVKKMPPEVVRKVKMDFGTMRLVLLCLHSLEEPFYNPAEMEELALKSVFKAGSTRFVGALCCLTLIKH